MEQKVKVKDVAELNAFFAAKKILIIGEHEWKGEETDFMQMVNKDGTIPKPNDKPNVDLRMRVKNRFGTELDLQQKNVFVIVSKQRINPTQN